MRTYTRVHMDRHVNTPPIKEEHYNFDSTLIFGLDIYSVRIIFSVFFPEIYALESIT